MSEEVKDQSEQTDEITSNGKLIEIIKSAAEEANQKTKADLVEEIMAKVTDMIPENLDLKTVMAEVDKYLKQKAEDEKPDAEEKDEKSDAKAEDKPDEEVTKPGPHADMVNKMADLEKRVKSQDELITKVTKALDEEQRKEKRPAANSAPDEVFKTANIKTGRHPVVSGANMESKVHWDVATPAGIAEALDIELGVEVLRADSLETVTVQGAKVTATPVWRRMITGPRLAPLCETRAIRDAGSFKTVQLVDKEYAKQTSVTLPSTITENNNIIESTVILEQWKTETAASFVQLEDVPGIAPTIETAFTYQYGKAQDDEVFSKLKGATGAKTVDSATSATLPTSAQIYDLLIDLMATVDLPYEERGTLVVNRDVWKLMLKAYPGQSGFAFNPYDQADIVQFNGHRVVKSDRLDTGSASGNWIAIFADFEAAAVVGERLAMTIWLDASEPGARQWHTRGRFGCGIKDINAFAGLRVKP